MNTDPTPEQRRQLGAAGTAAGLGCSIVASIVLSVVGGLAVDRWLDRSPVFTLIGVALGMAAAGYQLYELAQIGRPDKSAGPIARRIQNVPAPHRDRDGNKGQR